MNNNKQVVPFNFEQHTVRTVVIDGEPWFVAKDVAMALGYNWHATMTIGHVPAIWKGATSVVTPGGKQQMAILSEQGLYLFLNRSDSEAAITFQNNVNGEVLPTICKTGSYSVAKPLTREEQLAQASVLANQVIAELSEKNVEKDEQITQVSYERNEAIRTKAWISEKATAMGTAGAAVRKVKKLEEQLGDQPTY